MRILVISTSLPFPPSSGGGLRTYHLVRSLATRHEVTLVGFRFPGEAPPRPDFPVEIRAVPWSTPPLYAAMQGDDPQLSARATHQLEEVLPEPWIASYYESPDMEEALRDQAFDGIDLTIFLGSDAARFSPVLEGRTPLVLDFMDVLSLIAERAVARSADPRRARREAARTRAWERGVALRCDLHLACSATEAAAARDLLGIEDVAVIPNGVDTHRYVPPLQKLDTRSILFTGYMGYEPNREAARWFATEVMPRLRAHRCGARLDVVGAQSREALADLADHDIVLHGLVPDTLPFQHAAALVVAPILTGGGTRLKILEAAACGNAIVSTPLGAEGLDFVHGRDIVLAQDASEMALAVATLLGDPERRGLLGRRARDVATAYDWEDIGTRFVALLERRFGHPPRNPVP